MSGTFEGHTSVRAAFAQLASTAKTARVDQVMPYGPLFHVTSILLCASVYARAIIFSIETSSWMASFALPFGASMMVGTSLVTVVSPFVNVGLHRYVLTIVLSAHIFNLSSVPIIYSTFHQIARDSQIGLASFFGLFLLLVAQMFELCAHFCDDWMYKVNGHSQVSILNRLFNIGLQSSMVFIPVGFLPPSWIRMCCACAIPVMAGVSYGIRGKMKMPIRYSLQTFSSAWSSYMLIMVTGSWIPFALVASAIPIVHATLLLLRTASPSNQLLHVLPSIYSWFGIALTLKVATDPQWKGAPLSSVLVFLSASLFSCILINHLVAYLGRKIETAISKSNLTVCRTDSLVADSLPYDNLKVD